MSSRGPVLAVRQGRGSRQFFFMGPALAYGLEQGPFHLVAGVLFLPYGKDGALANSSSGALL